MDNISEHITYAEAIQSPTAETKHIINEPDESHLVNMRIVAHECFEPLRKWYRQPLKVDSFYRCHDLNKAVGGVSNSQHMAGEAIDISAGTKEENRKLYDWCKANLIFDQLIWEFGGAWVHISYKAGMNRNEAFPVGR